jgi:hypothetical protein
VSCRVEQCARGSAVAFAQCWFQGNGTAARRLSRGRGDAGPLLAPEEVVLGQGCLGNSDGWRRIEASWRAGSVGISLPILFRGLWVPGTGDSSERSSAYGTQDNTHGWTRRGERDLLGSVCQLSVAPLCSRHSRFVCAARGSSDLCLLFSQQLSLTVGVDTAMQLTFTLAVIVRRHLIFSLEHSADHSQPSRTLALKIFNL